MIKKFLGVIVLLGVTLIFPWLWYLWGGILVFGFIGWAFDLE